MNNSSEYRGLEAGLIAQMNQKGVNAIEAQVLPKNWHGRQGIITHKTKKGQGIVRLIMLMAKVVI